MLVLRIGRKSRWAEDRGADNPAHVAQAALDLELGPGEAGLSVFLVESEGERSEVAVRFALTCRERPAHLDYVVFPAELVTDLGLTIVPAPMAKLDPYLSERHHEILGLTPELGGQLAAAILASADRQVGRVRDRELLTLGAESCRRDPELRKHLKGDWLRRLAPHLDIPASGG
jgi:hypothetical protein